MGFLSKAFKAVAAPVTNTVKAVANVAQGDFSGAAKSAAGAFTSMNPLNQIESASDGKFGNAISAVPIIGAPVSKSVQAGSKISTGEFSNRDVKTYLRESAKTAALVYGGVTIAPTIGVPSALALARGDPSGLISEYAPEGSADFFNGAFSGLTQKPTLVGSDYATGSRTIASTSPAKKSSLSNTEIGILAAGALLTVAVFMKGRK